MSFRECEEPRWIANLSYTSTWLSVGSCLFCIQHLPCSVSFRRVLGSRVEVLTILYRCNEDQTLLVWPEVLKWIWLSKDRNRLLLNHIPTLPPRMHHNPKGIIDIVCKTTNVPSKSPIDLQNNSIDKTEKDKRVNDSYQPKIKMLNKNNQRIHSIKGHGGALFSRQKETGRRIAPNTWSKLKGIRMAAVMDPLSFKRHPPYLLHVATKTRAGS